MSSNKVLAERLRWDAAIWTDADRKEFDAAMKEYWAELQEKYSEEYAAAQKLRIDDPKAYREKMRELQRKLNDSK